MAKPGTAAADYFKGQTPAHAWTALHASLILLVAVLVLRRAYLWLRRSYVTATPLPPGSNLGAPRDQKSYYTPQLPRPQPLHYSFDPPAPHWVMKENIRGRGDMGGGGGGGGGDGIREHHVSFREDGAAAGPRALTIDSRWKPIGDNTTRLLMSRPPPAPPLTPPELSSAVFTIDGRPMSRDSFFNQPNPDYTSSSTSTSGSQPSTVDSPVHPRRRSYNKTIPIGVPISRQSTSISEDVDLMFSPSSYPPTSPVLPPAPPKVSSAMHDDDNSPEQVGIDVQGEIMSMLNSEGTGWTRHTRVYGGGVCLACAAAGRDHGDGGFYGATVKPEEMR